MKKIKKIAAAAIAAVMSISAGISVSAGFSEDEDGNVRYIKEDGSYAKGLYLAECDGDNGVCRMCDFDGSGVFRDYYTGFTKSRKGRRYYDRGIMLKGWQEINGRIYHFDDGYASTGKTVISGSTYTFGKNGAWTEKPSEYTYPKDFSVYFAKGIGYDDYFSTKSNEVGRQIDSNSRKSIKHTFTKNDLQMIWWKICEYDIINAARTEDNYDFEYAMRIAEETGAEVYDEMTYIKFKVDFTADGEEHHFTVTESVRYVTSVDETAYNVVRFTDHLNEILENCKEYKELPNSGQEYWE